MRGTRGCEEVFSSSSLPLLGLRWTRSSSVLGSRFTSVAAISLPNRYGLPSSKLDIRINSGLYCNSQLADHNDVCVPLHQLMLFGSFWCRRLQSPSSAQYVNTGCTSARTNRSLTASLHPASDGYQIKRPFFASLIAILVLISSVSASCFSGIQVLVRVSALNSLSCDSSVGYLYLNQSPKDTRSYLKQTNAILGERSNCQPK